MSAIESPLRSSAILPHPATDLAAPLHSVLGHIAALEDFLSAQASQAAAAEQAAMAELASLQRAIGAAEDSAAADVNRAQWSAKVSIYIRVL